MAKLPNVELRDQAPPQSLMQASVKPEPNLQEYYDLNSASRNELVTPGGMARLVGYRLKFAPADPEQGIFFLAADGQASQADFNQMGVTNFSCRGVRRTPNSTSQLGRMPRQAAPTFQLILVTP